jgi:DNA end-binding protein Ku
LRSIRWTRARWERCCATPDEVRSEKEYFDDIQDVKVSKDMLDLAKHIVNQKAGHFEPDKFEDQYETGASRPDQPEASQQDRHRKSAAARRKRGGSDGALRKSIGGGAATAKEAPKKSAKKPRKAVAGQKEMLMPIAGKKPKEAAAKKSASKPQRKSA